MTPCDYIDIVYGAGGSKPCPVYKVVLIMGGKEVEIKAAHDTRCQFLILGHFDFFEKLSYTIFDSTNRHTRLVKL